MSQLEENKRQIEKHLRKLARAREELESLRRRSRKPPQRDTRSRLDKLMALANDENAPVGERAAALAAIAKVTKADT
jgi:hypothetical protein